MVKQFPRITTPFFPNIMSFTEVGRKTAVGGETNLTVSNIPQKEWYIVLVWLNPQTSSMTNVVRLNINSGTGYDYRLSVNGAADVTTAASTGIGISNGAQSVP